MAASQLSEILTKVQPQQWDSTGASPFDLPLNILGDPTRRAAAGERDKRRKDEEKVWGGAAWCGQCGTPKSEMNFIWPLVQCGGVEQI